MSETTTNEFKKAVLTEALELLQKEGAWTKNTSARNSEGEGVNVLASDAVQFCLGGAVGHVVRKKLGASHTQQELDTLAALSAEIPEGITCGCGDSYCRSNISVFNDRQMVVGPVLDLLKTAISKL
jgi:hypothetical protein